MKNWSMVFISPTFSSFSTFIFLKKQSMMVHFGLPHWQLLYTIKDNVEKDALSEALLQKTSKILLVLLLQPFQSKFKVPQQKRPTLKGLKSNTSFGIEELHSFSSSAEVSWVL